MNFDVKLERRGTDSIKWGRHKGDDFLAMGTADMDFLCSDHIVNALVERAKTGIFAYESIPESYYKAVISWYDRRFGCKIEKEWLTNIPGVWCGMRLCVDTYTNPGDGVLLSAPYFHPAADLIKASGRKMVTSPLKMVDKRYYFDFEDFEAKIVEHNVKMYILINPQNPSGRVFTQEELLQMGEICLKHKVIIVSDEVHCNTVYSGHKHIPICAVSEEIAQNAILLAAPSKAFNLQGMTYAMVIIPNKEYADMFEKARVGYDFDFATNLFSITATEAAFTGGEEWLGECIAYLEANLDYLERYIQENIPEIGVIRPEGAYMVWLDFRKLGRTPAELYDMIYNEAKIAFTFGETFGSEGDGFERLNFACHRSTLEEGLERLKKLVKGCKV